MNTTEPSNTNRADTPPDRLNGNPGKPHFDKAAFERGVGVRFNGVEKNNVEEYCVSEGWVRVPVGRARDRHGNLMTVKLSGEVVVYYRDVGPPEAGA